MRHRHISFSIPTLPFTMLCSTSHAGLVSTSCRLELLASSLSPTDSTAVPLSTIATSTYRKHRQAILMRALTQSKAGYWFMSGRWLLSEAGTSGSKLQHPARFVKEPSLRIGDDDNEQTGASSKKARFQVRAD